MTEMTENTSSSEIKPQRRFGRLSAGLDKIITGFFEMDPEEIERDVQLLLYQPMFNAAVRLTLFLQMSDLAPRPAWDIGRYLDDPLDTPRKGELFDTQRIELNQNISRLFEYNLSKGPKRQEKVRKWARSIYSYLIRSYVSNSLTASDPEFKKSLKGIAWSVLATDIDKALVPNGQKPLSPEWKNQMRVAILSSSPDMKKVRAELKRFEAGDAEIFS